jgi:hypothetical protein
MANIEKINPEENKKWIYSHKKAAVHLQRAATHHLDAAKHFEAGNYEEGSSCSIEAHKELLLAQEASKQTTFQHTAY